MNEMKYFILTWGDGTAKKVKAVNVREACSACSKGPPLKVYTMDDREALVYLRSRIGKRENELRKLMREYFELSTSIKKKEAKGPWHTPYAHMYHSPHEGDRPNCGCYCGEEDVEFIVCPKCFAAYRLDILSRLPVWFCYDCISSLECPGQ